MSEEEYLKHLGSLKSDILHLKMKLALVREIVSADFDDTTKRLYDAYWDSTHDKLATLTEEAKKYRRIKEKYGC